MLIVTIFQPNMAPGTPNPAKMLLRNEVASRIAALSTEEKKRQSRVVYEKVSSSVCTSCQSVKLDKYK